MFQIKTKIVCTDIYSKKGNHNYFFFKNPDKPLRNISFSMWTKNHRYIGKVLKLKSMICAHFFINIYEVMHQKQNHVHNLSEKFRFIRTLLKEYLKIQ